MKYINFIILKVMKNEEEKIMMKYGMIKIGKIRFQEEKMIKSILKIVLNKWVLEGMLKLVIQME